MKKAFLFALPCILFSCTVFSQAVFEKTRVVDLIQNQQYEDAQDYLNSCYSRDSQNIQVLNYLGFVNNMLENDRVAEQFYLKALSLDTNNLAALKFLADVNNTDNADLAIIMAQRLISVQPSKASNYRNLGKLYRSKRQKDLALMNFNTAYILSPADYKNAAALSEILIETRNFKRADSIITAGLQRDTSNITLLRLSLKSAFEKKDFKTACLQGEKLMRLNDVSLIALTNAATAYLNLKLYTDCIRVCDYMLMNELESETVFYYKAKCYAGLMNFQKSNELLQVCLDKSISNNLELYFYSIGQNYEALKQYEKAVSNYDTAHYFSKDPVMYYNMAVAYETGLKNLPLAKKYYEKFLTASKPQTEEEKKVYAYVKERWWKK